jgi:CRP/FNR family transcriptional regulator, cyclic AMP receptor protein
MVEATETFNPRRYLATIGPGRSMVHHKAKGKFFSQGTNADSVFYLRSGRGKLSVVSKKGKEATVTQLAKGDFFGEEAMAEVATERTSTATAVTPCTALKITRSVLIRALREEPSLSVFLMNFLVVRGIRTQADLVDQLFNSSERRLARVLLLMAEYGADGEAETLIPPITQEALAEMIGTTRSHVSFFMNRFRKLGYIEYNGRIRVNRSLLNMVLHDQLPDENASRPKLLDPSPSPAQALKRSKKV